MPAARSSSKMIRIGNQIWTQEFTKGFFTIARYDQIWQIDNLKVKPVCAIPVLLTSQSGSRIPLKKAAGLNSAFRRAYKIRHGVKWYRYRNIVTPHGIGIKLSKYRVSTGKFYNIVISVRNSTCPLVRDK